MVTYNRLAYSQRTLKEFRDTIKLPHYFMVVDNCSDDGTKLWLADMKKDKQIDDYIINNENLYPGKATNIGWEQGLIYYPEATHLMRIDNDTSFKDGWAEVAEDYFKKIPELGQLGLDHEAIEHPKAALRVLEINGKKLNPWPGCVGGINIIRKSLWDMGIKYEPMRWDDGRKSPMQEDSNLSRKIQSKGYLTGHMTEDLVRTFANTENWKDYPEYYKKTMTERGYDEKLKEANI